jgi:hypothetical protein
MTHAGSLLCPTVSDPKAPRGHFIEVDHVSDTAQWQCARCGQTHAKSVTSFFCVACKECYCANAACAPTQMYHPPDPPKSAEPCQHQFTFYNKSTGINTCQFCNQVVPMMCFPPCDMED